ncbi:PIN domain-containing protein [Candidatus Gottesmanbacteria bacterium]|nr:PIN domain-containing protein [Candidatus Gottesmanbacteria bacterium]
MTILIDSSFYISFAYWHDSNHQRALALYPKYKTFQKLTTEDFLKETLTTISQRLGKKASIELYELISQDTEVISISPAHFQAGLRLFVDPRRQKNISLIDCIACAVAEDIATDAILTFNRHFLSLGLTVIPRS